MPIQETLTGITFPSPTLNINTIPNPLAYFGSLLQLWVKADVGITSATSPAVAVTASAITSNVGTVTITLNTAPNNVFTVGETVTFAGLTNATALNGTFTILSLPTFSTLNVAVPAGTANVASAAESAGTATIPVVSVWADQSSYGRNLSGSSNDPAIVPASQNGLPGVVSSGANSNSDELLRAAYSASMDFLSTTPFSVVLAFKPGSASDDAIGTGTGPGWYAGTYNSKPMLRLCNSQSVQAAVSGSISTVNGTPYIVQYINAGTGAASGIQIYVNGVLATNTVILDNLAGASTQIGSSGVSLPAIAAGGGGFPSRATAYEAAVISKALTARDVQIMDAYLNNKWAIHS